MRVEKTPVVTSSSDSSSCSSKGGSSSNSDSSPSSAAGVSVAVAPVLDAVAPSVSSSSSDSSSSSSENVSVVSPQVPDAIGAAVGRGAIAVGLNSMIPTYRDNEAYGWEAKCKHPRHHECRLNRKGLTETRSEALTVRMLQQWLWLGRNDPDVTSHKARWREVEAMVSACRFPFFILRH